MPGGTVGIVLGAAGNFDKTGEIRLLLAALYPTCQTPVSGNPVPLGFIDLVVVPGLGFTEQGHRIGRGMGFYDRFLAQSEFLGVSCGLAFEEQVIPSVPMLDHDVALCMLATDRGIRRVRTACIERFLAR